MSRIAFFDCFSGISGDMIIAALIDAGLDFDDLQAELKKLNLTNYAIKHHKVEKQNLAATRFEVLDNGGNDFRFIEDLNQIVENSKFSAEVKTTAKKIIFKIAEAEAKIHNQPVEKVHFHEIGAVDTIIDVVGTLIGLQHLGIEKSYCSKMNVGSGFVDFSHGTFPVPAPATAELLKEVPVYSTDTKAELVTPTGAAIITTIAEQFGDMPEMELENIGYGAGTRELQHPNVLRVFIGQATHPDDSLQETVAVIETNIDDMNPQFYDHIMESLLKNGALDVYLSNQIMKKNRPAVKLSVLAQPQDVEKLANILFAESTTLGVRIRQETRRILQREIREIETRFGKIKIKIAKQGEKILNWTPEYEDCKKMAQDYHIPLKEVYRELEKKVASEK